MPFSVIPAKAGIQLIHDVLDPGVRRVTAKETFYELINFERGIFALWKRGAYGDSWRWFRQLVKIINRSVIPAVMDGITLRLGGSFRCGLDEPFFEN
jgi:hypothetical protein